MANPGPKTFNGIENPNLNEYFLNFNFKTKYENLPKKSFLQFL